MKIIKQRPLLTNSIICEHSLLNRIYQARGVNTQQEIDYRLAHLLHPKDLKNIDKALDLLTKAHQKQQKIVIVGDFDTDGATSTTLALLALKDLGFKKVEYLIPDRFIQGYGLSPLVAQTAIELGAELVITVDNGISSVDGVALLKEHNINVLITDHHLAPELLPNADALINPNLKDCSFGSKSLAGVGVIFYVMAALRTHLMNIKAVENPPNFTQYLDLVALGTVADVVPLDHNNRILVDNGIKRMQSSLARPGINALFEIARRDITKTKASDLGFSIAPRLNAAGRLDNMAIGVELLLCNDEKNARSLAYELDHLNQMRKSLELEMKDEALNICRKMDKVCEKSSNPYAIVLYQPDWHQGVLGILASRIKDKFNRPVIAFAKENDESEFMKGSARSINGLHIKDVLERIDSQHPHLIEKFGGHAMAAGLTLKCDHLEEFTNIFYKTVKEILGLNPIENIIETDGALQTKEITIATAELIEEAGPWGQHFPKPIFDNEFTIVQQKIVGTNHLKVLLEKDHQLFDGIYFNVDLKQFPDRSITKARIVYTLDINEFRGNRNVQLLIQHIEAL